MNTTNTNELKSALRFYIKVRWNEKLMWMNLQYGWNTGHQFPIQAYANTKAAVRKLSFYKITSVVMVALGWFGTVFFLNKVSYPFNNLCIVASLIFYVWFGNALLDIWASLINTWIGANWVNRSFHSDVIEMLKVCKLRESDCEALREISWLEIASHEKLDISPRRVVSECEHFLMKMIVDMGSIEPSAKDILNAKKKEVKKFYQICTRLGTLKPNFGLHQYYGKANEILGGLSRKPRVSEEED